MSGFCRSAVNTACSRVNTGEFFSDHSKLLELVTALGSLAMGLTAGIGVIAGGIVGVLVEVGVGEKALDGLNTGLGRVGVARGGRTTGVAAGVAVCAASDGVPGSCFAKPIAAMKSAPKTAAQR